MGYDGNPRSESVRMPDSRTINGSSCGMATEKSTVAVIDWFYQFYVVIEPGT